MTTIADFKYDIILAGFSLEEFINNLKDENRWSYKPNKELIKNLNRGVENGNYEFSVVLIDSRSFAYNQITEIIQIKSQNHKLVDFMHLLYLKLSHLIDKYGDWHCHLKGFKRINDFEYEVILGS